MIITSDRIQKIKKVKIFRKYVKAAKGIQRVESLNAADPILLDTSLGSYNAGDYIIMHFIEKQLSEIWGNLDDRIPTHVFPKIMPKNVQNRMKILCGTNALSGNLDTMHSVGNWITLPNDASQYEHSLLMLAVGMRNVEAGKGGFTPRAAAVLRYLLTDQFVHSVRDSHTEKALNEIGINNVVNTSCVTMWDLTPDFCRSIPCDKAEDVLTTITDYDFDPENDGYMLQTLKRHYRRVYLWLQGADDLNCLKSLQGVDGIHLVHGGLSGLEEFVSTHENFDYFGTRLHCGIYCLNHQIRSMIVSIDNRAADIQQDTNIPTVQRCALKTDMERLIEDSRSTDIHIPVDSIKIWKNQFLALEE